MNSKLFHHLIMPGLLFLAFVSPRTTAFAQDAASNSDRPPTKTELKRYDADKDGRLNEEETAHMKEDEKERKEAREKRLLAKYDANRNGRIDPDEQAKIDADKKAAHDRRQAQRAARQAAKENAAPAGEMDSDSR